MPRPSVALAPRKGREKNFWSKIPCNPLKSPDSHERIQGNPRKSNSPSGGFSQRKGYGIRQSKRTQQKNNASLLSNFQTRRAGTGAAPCCEMASMSAEVIG